MNKCIPDRTFLRNCFQSLGIKSTINLYILLWLAVVKSSFLPNVAEEIRHGCKHLQTSHLSEIFLGGGCYEKQVFSLYCGFKNTCLVKNFLYRRGGREIVIGIM